jgi:hypothetical protein
MYENVEFYDNPIQISAPKVVIGPHLQELPEEHF